MTEEIKITEPGVYAVQAQLYADGEWQNRVEKAPEPLTFQEYIFTGGHSSIKTADDDEILCPVCRCSGKEQLLPDGGVRIYHPARLIPCRAPADYVPLQPVADQLVPA